MVELANGAIRPMSEDERQRRLAQVYSLLLRIGAQKETADRDEFGDQAQSAAESAPAERPEMP